MTRRLAAVVVIVGLANLSCSATGGETVIIADAATTPTAVATDQASEPTPSEPATAVPTAVPEPTATPVPATEAPERLVGGETTRGTITDAVEPVLFEFVAEAGDTFALTVEPLDQDLDVVVDVVDSRRQSIFGGDVDDSFFTEFVDGIVVEESGVYTVIVSSYDDNIGDVAVTVDFAVAVALGQPVRFGQATPIEVTASGVAQITFVADEGEWIDITVVPVDDLDVVVDVRNSDGVSFLENGPVDRSFGTERIRVLEMPADGLYSVVVSGYEGASGFAEAVVERSLAGSGTFLRGSDVIDDPEEPQEFPFTAFAGDVVRLIVQPDSPDHDVVVLVIEAETGDVLYEVDATTGLEELVIEVPQDGDYYFQVWSFDDSVGSFDFVLLAPETAVLELVSNDQLIGRTGNATSLQYIIQPPNSGTLTIAVDAIDETEVTLALFDAGEDRVIDAEGTDDGRQIVTYEVAADVIYVIDVATGIGGGAFELDITVE